MMKLNRQERTMIIECLSDSIEFDNEALKLDKSDTKKINDDIKRKQELMVKLGEAIGYK